MKDAIFMVKLTIIVFLCLTGLYSIIDYLGMLFVNLLKL